MRADGAISYREVMAVMNLLRQAGYLKVALVGLEDTGGPAAIKLMVAMRPIHHQDGEATRQVLLRWSLAGLCVVALYGGIVGAALNWPRERRRRSSCLPRS